MAILALDQGTTSSRAIIFDNSFSIVTQSSRQITQYYPKPGWVEHDAREILETTYQCAKECIQSGDLHIDAIGITNQRETVIAWNKITGEPIANAIVWQCRRTSEYCEELLSDDIAAYIKETTGLGVDAYFSATKMKWILDNVKGARELADEGNLLFGTVDSWLIWNLTGNHYTDITNASRTMLYDIKKQRWDERICQRLGIPTSTLATVTENCFDYGVVRSKDTIPCELWGIPVCSAVGDQQAAMFGQQCFNQGDVKNTYGTGCFTLMNIGSEFKLSERLLTTVAWKIGGKTVYAIEGSVFNAGSSIQWLRDELRIISSAPECDRLAESCKSSEGVVFVSAFTGLGAPHWDMYARGSFLGLTRGSGREVVCRAVLEGIAFQVYDLVHTMELETKCSVSTLRVDGGASVSDILMQFQADILRCSVDRPVCIESTALGAAYMAALKAGAFTEKELESKRVSQRVYNPEMPESDAVSEVEKWHRAVDAVRSFSKPSKR